MSNQDPSVKFKVTIMMIVVAIGIAAIVFSKKKADEAKDLAVAAVTNSAPGLSELNNKLENATDRLTQMMNESKEEYPDYIVIRWSTNSSHLHGKIPWMSSGTNDKEEDGASRSTYWRMKLNLVSISSALYDIHMYNDLDVNDTHIGAKRMRNALVVYNTVQFGNAICYNTAHILLDAEEATFVETTTSPDGTKLSVRTVLGKVIYIGDEGDYKKGEDTI